MLTSQIMSISVGLIKNCFAVNSLCCLVHILVCLYYQCVQTNWPAALLAALQPLNSSLAIGHNPVVHSLLRQITKMAFLLQKKKKLRPLNHLLFLLCSSFVSLPGTPPTERLVEHDVNFIHKGIDQEFDIIRVKLWYHFYSASVRVMNHGWSHQ